MDTQSLHLHGYPALSCIIHLPFDLNGTSPEPGPTGVAGAIQSAYGNPDTVLRYLKGSRTSYT